jgi:hypothetical protein
MIKVPLVNFFYVGVGGRATSTLFNILKNKINLKLKSFVK